MYISRVHMYIYMYTLCTHTSAVFNAISVSSWIAMITSTISMETSMTVWRFQGILPTRDPSPFPTVKTRDRHTHVKHRIILCIAGERGGERQYSKGESRASVVRDALIIQWSHAQYTCIPTLVFHNHVPRILSR